MKASAAPFALLLLGFLSACSLLEPREDATRFFTLSASANSPAVTAEPPPPAAESAVVVVGPVHLPDYLLRPEIVRRTGLNQLEPAGADRWAEPLDRAFARVLRLDLSTLLPKCTLVEYPVTPAVKPAVQIEVDVSAFEGDREGRVRLEAHWTLRDVRAGSRVVHACSLERPSANGKTPELVATMSALLGELADQVAREVGPEVATEGASEAERSDAR